ncbi:hypothetical protein TNCV_2981081 [Trichonephila clavipes]|nr:hypothetical protein TNCV_2981081 [Trichonephila clavipes]
MDDNGNGVLSFEEFQKGLHDSGMDRSMDGFEIEELFQTFDKDNSGSISYEEFLRAVRCTQGLCRLSHRSIATHVGRDPMTVIRICNRWIQEGRTEHRAGFQRPVILNSRGDRHVTHMFLMDRSASSRILSQEMASFIRHQVSSRTIRRRQQQYESSG